MNRKEFAFLILRTSVSRLLDLSALFRESDEISEIRGIMVSGPSRSLLLENLTWVFVLPKSLVLTSIDIER